MSIATDTDNIKKLFESEPIFKAASSEQQARRREELMSRPMYKYGNELLELVRKQFGYLEITSDVNEEGDFYIEAYTPNKRPPQVKGTWIPDHYVPFAIWLHTDGVLMILVNVYDPSEHPLCSYDVPQDWPDKKLLVAKLQKFIDTQDYR